MSHLSAFRPDNTSLDTRLSLPKTEHQLSIHTSKLGGILPAFAVSVNFVNQVVAIPYF